MTNTVWTNGDVSESQTLTNNDHLYPSHINELRVATNTLEARITIPVVSNVNCVF